MHRIIARIAELERKVAELDRKACETLDRKTIHEWFAAWYVLEHQKSQERKNARRRSVIERD